MTILEHPLVVKYFECDKDAGCLHSLREGCLREMALRILSAMQEPIRKTDWYLCITKRDGVMSFKQAHGNISLFNRWHPECFRLPDRFQPPPPETKECCKCDVCRYDYQRYCREHTQPAPAEKGEHNYCLGKEEFCCIHKPDMNEVGKAARENRDGI